MEMTGIPPKVAAAICAVMADVPKLGKGEKNKHGDYKFASIDDFLEAVRPLCAKHGLIIAQDEESFDMREGWLVIAFSFTLAHSSGETWGLKQRRTIMVSAKMGAQAFGAAQSYALKQYMRALFQIATGEAGNDADEHPNADLPNITPKPDNTPQDKATKDADWHGPLNKTDLQTAMRSFGRDLEACDDLDTFMALMNCAVTIKGTKHQMADIHKQCAADLPSWWNGNGGDVKGAAKRIEEMRDYLTGKEADHQSFAA